ncbi:MAG: protein phosphatase 2C domain-containing protein [Tannerella sp.]|nr:protein phosphatase 2C domain-containing protein [Tannerella sp.]
MKTIIQDENQINDFIKNNEAEIKASLKKIWETCSPSHSPDLQTDDVPKQTDDVPGQAAVEQETPKNNQPTPIQTDMAGIFDAKMPGDPEKARNDALEIKIKNKNITFANGKINQSYSIRFDVEALDIPEIAEVSFDGLDTIGLAYFPERKIIEGIPAQAGDHKIVMHCKRKDWQEGKPVFERTVTLIINPDPKSLWKNIPAPHSIEYYKPDADMQFVKVEARKRVFSGSETEEPRKDMVAASQRGRSHALEGKPRDDDFALNFDDATEWYTMVVADGAGSAGYSRKGSQIACRTVIEVCGEQLTACMAEFEKSITVFEKEKSQENRNRVGKILYGIIGNAAFKAYKAIEKEANSCGRPVKDYATTLLLSVCKKFDFGWFVAAFWIGDGGIGIYNKDTSFLKVLGEPDGGEFAGQTRFLTMPEIIQNSREIFNRLRFDIYPDFTALILMTDGVTDPKFETDANLNKVEKWHALWDDLNGNNEDHAKVEFTDDNEQTAGQLLKWLDFWSKGNHDDRTIAILF